MNINYEYYKVFYYVSQQGSLTGAARELCISQPAVSQALRQLEGEVGVKLFSRTSRGVQLTREGEVLYRYVRAGVESLMEGERMVEQMRDKDTGEVRIGASDMTLQFFLLPFSEKFHQQYPGIKVNVTNAPTPETIDSLRWGKIDFGVVSTPFRSQGEIQSVPVKEIRNVFIAGTRFEYLKGRKLDYSVLRKVPCIFLESNTSTRSFMDQFLRQQGIQVKPEFELAISDMVVQFAKRNMGVGCVVEGFAREALERGEVFELNFDHPMPKRQICVVTAEKAVISLAGRSLLEMVMGEEKADA